MLINFRRAPLMWKDMRGPGVSLPVDGQRELPVWFDFIKRIKHPKALNGGLVFCHGYDVEPLDKNNPYHLNRSHIRGAQFVRRTDDRVPLIPLEITLVATAVNAHTCKRNFLVSIVNGQEIVELSPVRPTS
jgi:hypothetical protein